MILDKQDDISHRINWGKVIYSKDGISLKFLFGLLKVAMNWKDIIFCSLTPSVEKVNNEWEDFRGVRIENIKHLEIRIALKNRHKVSEGINLFFKIWLISILSLKPLFNADDKPLPEKGVILINVKLKTLSVGKKEFIELLSKESKFDLIV